MSTTTRPVRRRTRMLLVGALSATLFAGGLGASPASAHGRHGHTQPYFDIGTDTNTFQCLDLADPDCTDRTFGESVGKGWGHPIGRFTSLGGTYTLANGDQLYTDAWQFVDPGDVTCREGEIPVKQTAKFAGGTGRFARATGAFTFRACVKVLGVDATGHGTYTLRFTRIGTIRY